MKTERNEQFCFQTEPMIWQKILKVLLQQELRRQKRMEYRLPKEDDEKDIRELLEEYFRNGEREVIICQDMLLDDFDKYMGPRCFSMD